MSRNTRCLTAVLAAGVIVATGHGLGAERPMTTRAGATRPASAPAEPARTPKDAAVHLARAIERGDKGLFLASVHTTDEELALATFRLAVAIAEVERAVEKAVGKVKGDERRPVVAGWLMPPPEVVKKAVFAEAGEKAVARLPDGRRLHLVKRSGRWRVDMSRETPKGQDRKKRLKACKAFLTAVKELGRAVGQKGSDPKKIGRTLGYTMKQLSAGVTGRELRGPPVLRLQCEKCGHVWEKDLTEEELDERMTRLGPDGLWRFDCPRCKGQACCHGMVPCPACGAWYVSRMLKHMSERWRRGEDPNVEAPKDICPHCGTDRVEWYLKAARERRRLRKDGPTPHTTPARPATPATPDDF